MVFGRSDGKAVERVHPIRQVMYHLMPGRNQSAVYFEQQVDVEEALAYAQRLSEAGPHRVTLFHLVLRAAARVLHEHPRLNRFVAGRRLYQRNAVEIGFTLKQEFSEKAPVVAVKREFPAGETLDEMVGDILGMIARGRRGKGGALADLETNLAARMPRVVTAGVVSLLKGLDAAGLLPASMLKGDPLFASLFVANLGSLGLEAGYHHLYEYGNIPIFMTVGRIAKRPVVRNDEVVLRQTVNLRYTFDERIEDGFAAARALERLQEYLENPEVLD